MKNPLKKHFFDDVRKRKWPKTGNETSPSVLILYRNRSGVIELVGREPLIFAKVENGVTISCQNFRRKDRKTKFWRLKVSTYIFEQDCLLFARVEIGVTEFRQSNTTRAARAAQGCTDDGVRVDTGTLRE